MTEAVLSGFEQAVSEWTLIPSGGGRFEVTVDGELVYSKAQTGRFPEPHEIQEAIKARL